LKLDESNWLRCDDIPVHAGECAHDVGEKRNVLIVSVLLPIGVNFVQRIKMQRRIEVVGMRYQSWTGRRPGSGGRCVVLTAL
jgi:hypothetical protein